MRDRDNAKTKANSSGESVDKEQYCALRNKVVKMNKKKKKRVFPTKD